MPLTYALVVLFALASATVQRTRRPRRAVNYDESEPDDDGWD